MIAVKKLTRKPKAKPAHEAGRFDDSQNVDAGSGPERSVFASGCAFTDSIETNGAAAPLNSSSMNDIRVLLIEGELSDASFIQEALAEIEETTHGGAWVHCRVTHLECLEDAVVVLTTERPDIVLFNPVLPDSRGMETFCTLRDVAAGIPLVALLDPGEEGLGRRMLREGAQDFVIKCEIDCRPLARSILNAIERQRFQRSTQLSSAIDLETGFYNPDGFAEIAARDLQLARKCNRELTLLIAEVDDVMEVDSACGREAVHELVVEASTVIRTSMGESALAARLGLARFGLVAWHTSPNELIGRLQNSIQAGHHAFAFVFGFTSSQKGSTFADLMETAEAVLYENKQAYSNLL